MSRTSIGAIALSIIASVACAPGQAASSDADQPAAFAVAKGPPLVVLVVVDQLRADLLQRYAELFTGGFKRLNNDGRSYLNASHAHASTETATGHASLATGVHPNRHGIIANSWYERSRDSWVLVPNVADPTVKIVGHSGPGVSPTRLKVSGFAEWLVASDRNSIVASASGKDRGAVHTAAHVKGAYVYWFDPGAGRFVTSTYYRRADPSWITQFNSTTIEAHRADTVWDLLVPPAALARATRDTSATAYDRKPTSFPHRFSKGRPESFWPWWLGTPYQDVATLELAQTMVTSLAMGRDASPDFLSVSLSATDLIGHGYGPLSLEQMDNLLRLDRKLGEFLAFLDRSVGKGKWALMLTADHGVLDTPEYLVARGEYGHRLTRAELERMEALVRAAAGNSDPISAARRLAADLEKLEFVSEAYTHEELRRGQPRDSMELLERRSVFPGRFGSSFARAGVEVRLKPGVLTSSRASSHGTAWWYDRHVPMIFIGPGITPGRDTSRAETVDFAPTFATLLGLTFPRGLDGKVLIR